jgi:Glutathione synthase/Ribosomal protein S6 modification enzyme (glutaminyl transferase)
VEDQRSPRSRYAGGPLDSQIKEIAFKAKEVLDLDYAGIDLVESDRGYLLLEVNASLCGKDLKAATGIDVAERLVKYMLNALKR